MPQFHRAAAVAALCLTTFAACGGDPAPKSAAPAGDNSPTTATTTAATPLDLVLASSRKVADSRTMRFSLAMDMGSQGSFTGEGAMDSNGPVMTMTMDMASLLPAEARQAGSKVSMIVKDQAMYMQYPGLAAETGGKDWIRVDLAALGADNPLAPLAEQLRSADPTKSLGYLDGAQDVSIVGSEAIRDVETTHYKFTIDLQKGLASLPAELRDTMATAISQLGTKTLPGEVWLDADGLPRRFSYDMALPIPGAPPAIRISMEFFDYGQPVSVSVPAANQVIDASQLD